MSTDTQHLWETKHPYYCNEGNFFSLGCHTVYESWCEFFAAEGDADPDYNLVFRWDWLRADEGDDRLLVYWVGQRKALLRSTECAVTADDEPAVRIWLEERAKKVAAIWAPISLSGGVAP